LQIIVRTTNHQWQPSSIQLQCFWPFRGGLPLARIHWRGIGGQRPASKQSMKAMILAAGFGERLWPLTADPTRPALPVLGKPLVGYVAEYLSKFGIKDVVVNLHHQPESVRRSLGDGSRFGVALQYVYEPVILGTSGALDNAGDLLQGDTFVVVNGKIITD